jgi:hypothetical protein
MVKETSTFRKETFGITTFVTLPHIPALTKGLERSLDLNVSYTAGPSLQSLLGNPKDKVNRNEKSGIYEINYKDYNQKYIGQTKRPIITRFKEHMAHR